MLLGCDSVSQWVQSGSSAFKLSAIVVMSASLAVLTAGNNSDHLYQVLLPWCMLDGDEGKS